MVTVTICFATTSSSKSPIQLKPAPTSEPPASTISDRTGTSEANQVSESELDEHGNSDSGHSATGTEAVPLPSVTSAPLKPQSEDTVSELTSAIVRCHAGEDQTAHWGGCRKRLSMGLTSRFESAGLSCPSQPPAKENNQKQEQATKRETAVLKVSVLRTKEEEKITDSPETPSDPECRLKHSAPLKEERFGEGVKETGEEKVLSIQRRISLLLDSSSRPEPLTKREEVPDPIKQADGSGGVKQRIKDWALDTPPVQASNQRVDVAPQPIPCRVHCVLSVTGGSLATSESVQLAPREDKASTLCRSGRSGIKVNSEEIEDEEEEGEEEGEEKGAQVPLYKPVGRLLRMEDGGKKQELVIDQIEKDMETKVQEEEKLKQLELEERQAEKEREKERKQEVELERQKQVEKEKERERRSEKEERKMKEEGRERQREIERERDRQRQREEEERERKRKEEDRERERQRGEERDRERQREDEERENMRKEEKERERQIELEREKEILREEEERERRKEERETERQIEVKWERERPREEEERERRKEERETDRQIELEREREILREEEEREMFRVEEERLREEDKEKLIEEERKRERKREEEKMKEDERQREKEQARERQREEEREKEQVESPVQLITLEPDHSPKPELPSRSPSIPIIEPILKDEEQPHIKVVYSFSNKEEKTLLEVVNDNFSIKLGRWGSQTRLLADCAQDETSSPGRLLGLQKTVVNTQEALNVKSHPAEGNIEWVVPTPENRMEKVDEEEEANVDTEEEQLKCCVGAGEGHDTEALIGGELDKQYGGCDTRLSEDDSLQTTVEQISPVTPDEPNSTSPLEETEELLAFPDISPLLDTSAQRARAKLRKSRRTRPPRAVHQNSTTATLEENRVHDWRFCDSSDKVDSLTRGDCESDEEQPRGREVCSPPSQPQRIPLFSGMDPSALKAQLKKRTGGGVKGADTDSQTDSLALSPSQLSRSPGCSSFLPRTSQILPPVVNKDGGGDSSPSWLQELKSKKRLSQYNSED
ncbi:golgin subfamily A member 6-like protein 22 [Oncorhynchus keta]|uniref:golgin subfamily A member 6-like protein 22 n=1 Tax=Oncorhynchus keta TaxID=8018 RepID=UPI00227BD225|nr:golgin subfamily A member 6-like protein 22 [Oncorhynchus keta]